MMFKQMFLPTDCKLCYWGRLALFTAAGVELGIGLGRWIEIPLVAIVVVMAGLKWLVARHS